MPCTSVFCQSDSLLFIFFDLVLQKRYKYAGTECTQLFLKIKCYSDLIIWALLRIIYV